MKSNLRRLLGSGIDLLHSWWQVDRIRVSPREGGLLRLRPPCLIQLCSQSVEVQRRRVDRDSEEPCIVYDCLGPFGPGELRVRPVGVREGPQLRWIGNWGEQVLSADDIQLWG